MTGEITRSQARSGRLRSWAATHRGTVRASNQDTFVNRPDLGLWAVADGAGGHRYGEIASAEVSGTLERIPSGLPALAVLGEVRTRLEAAHLALRARMTAMGPGAMMATTVVVVLAHEGHFACLWAGDSRAYLLRDGALTQVSRDHSLVEELLESGAITPEQALRHPQANVVTRAIGADVDVLDLDKRSGRLLPGDLLLLCSDGLCKALEDSEIAALLDHDGANAEAASGAAPEADGAERLVRAALAVRATDNVTAVTIRIEPG